MFYVAQYTTSNDRVTIDNRPTRQFAVINRLLQAPMTDISDKSTAAYEKDGSAINGGHPVRKRARLEVAAPTEAPACRRTLVKLVDVAHVAIFHLLII